jgi:hypothetical protein
MREERLSQQEVTYRAIGSLVVAVMLFVGIANLPYGYYALLRWVVTLVAAYSAWLAYRQEATLRFVLLVGTAVLFNPLAEVHLSKAAWVVIDFAAALGFVLLATTTWFHRWRTHRYLSAVALGIVVVSFTTWWLLEHGPLSESAYYQGSGVPQRRHEAPLERRQQAPLERERRIPDRLPGATPVRAR